MGWAFGVNSKGRDIGYGVIATCDQEQCETQIDRGLSYVCGGFHDGDTYGCGDYFCSAHLASTCCESCGIDTSQLCPCCIEEFESAHPCDNEEQ